MNVITEARKEVAQALSSLEVPVYAYIPGEIDGETVLVTPGSPYVTPGQVMGEFRVALSLRLFAPQGAENEVVSEALDELIVNVCAALKPYGVITVSQPGIDRESYAVPYLVTDITITFDYEGGV